MWARQTSRRLADKKALPMIIVMPWGHAVPYGGPQSNNAAMVERYLVEEVMAQVERKYRVAPCCSARTARLIETGKSC
jgi:hypothetical protein